MKKAPEEYTHGMVLSPMAGYTDSAFRRICRRFGATGLVTEMVAAAGLSRKSSPSHALLRFTQEEKPIGIQLFGARPDDFRKAAEIVSPMGFDFIDINAGCPVKKVVKSGSGSALLRDLPKLLTIIRASVESTDLPVTVKIRIGWSPDEPVPPDFPEAAAQAGASAIAVHGRFQSDMFSGHVNAEAIAELVRNSPVPVLANGDSTGIEAVLNLRTITGATGFLVGRGALGNPWIFRGLAGNPDDGRPFPGELSRTVLMQLDMMSAYIPEKHLYHIMRGHLVHYFKGFPGASGLRVEAVRSETREEIENLAEKAEVLMQKHSDSSG